MTVTPENYRAHVGYVLFPRSSEDLTDTTRCPACHSPLASLRCQTCGLDVSSPVAIDLADASTEAAEALERRLALIGRIRFESAQAATTPAVAVPAAAVASPATLVPPAAAPPLAAPPASAPPFSAQPVAAPPVAAPPRRQISVQVVLLLVGVALLSIGAIFFLVYAFINFGLVWRSIIIATVTIAAYVGATMLTRRRLTATAESVAVLAVVLTYLDAFAIRANDLLVVGDSRGFLHWGVTLLVTAAGFILWNRLTGLRVPSVVGFAAVGPGLAFITLGLTENLSPTFSAYLAILAVAVGCLAHPLAGRLSRPLGPALLERYLLLAAALVSLVSAGVLALIVSPQTPYASTLALLVVAATATAHADLALRTRVPVGFPAAFAGLGAVTAAGSFIESWWTGRTDPFSVMIPLVAAVIVAVALEVLLRRRRQSDGRTTLRVASIVAVVTAGVVAIPYLLASLGAVAEAARFGRPVWSQPATHALDLRPEQFFIVAALAVVVTIVVGAWAAQGILRGRLPLVLWAAAFVVLLAAPLASALWATVALWIALGVGGAITLLRLGRSHRGLIAPVATGTAGALALGYAASWASADTWLVGSLGVIVALLIGRQALGVPALRAIAVGVAAVVALVAAGAGGWRVQALSDASQAAGVFSTAAVLALAVVLLAATALAARALSMPETRTIFWIALPTAVVTATALWLTSTVTGAALISDLIIAGAPLLVGAGVGFVVVLLLWMLSAATETFRFERLAASIVLAPALAWFAVSLALALLPSPPPGALAIFAVISALLVAACALGIVRFSPGLNLRWAVDVGAALVTAGSVLVAVIGQSNLGWLVLVLAAIVALVTALSPDGLFASSSPRRVIGWVSLALAVGGLVWLLATEQVRDVAAYVLPPAGALLLIAAAAWFSAGRRGLASSGAPGIALAGLSLALVPLGLVHSEHLSGWLVLIAGVSVALVLKGTLLPAGTALRPYLDAAALAGALGLVASAYGRSFALATGRDNGIELVIWLAVALITFVVGAFGVAGRRAPIRAGLSQIVVGIPLVATFLLGMIAVANESAGLVSAVALVVLFSAAHVAAGILDRPPFTRAVGWAAIGLAVATWLVASSLGALAPLERATVPIGLALLVTGAVHLARVPAARSWPALSPGILVVIAPSLLASFVDEPIWRLVGVGIACVITIVAGALLRLQAPLVLGSVLVLIHALRTFAPQIVAVYQLTEWWVWAVVGGAIIFFIGFTFEKRKRDFQRTATAIAALR